MSENNSQTIQDYLKHIYNLTENGTPANTSLLASQLGLKPGSVSEMVSRLSATEPPLVNYIKYQGVTLTTLGREMALRVIRRHRLIETFLVEVLGYSWDMVHEEACELEHVVTDIFEARIASVLGNPRFSPHGEPIPEVDLSMPAQFTTKLGSLLPGQKAIIQQVPDSDPELLRYLRTIAIVPQKELVVLNRSNFDGNLTLSLQGQSENIILGPVITKKIFVTIME